MKQYNNEQPEMTIGLNLGDRYSYFVILDGSGEQIEEGRVATRSRTLGQKFGGLQRARTALEVGTHSGWMSRLLESLGHEVLVAKSLKLRLIYDNPRKQDRVDAQYLARLARVDSRLLCPGASAARHGSDP